MPIPTNSCPGFVAAVPPTQQYFGVPGHPRYMIPLVRRNAQPTDARPGDKIDPCFIDVAAIAADPEFMTALLATPQLQAAIEAAVAARLAVLFP